jgi:HK97 family phage prohead protease
MPTRSDFELREVPNGAGGMNLRFTGFACVTGDDAAYEMEDWLGPWTESVSIGAFTKTLAEGADCAFLLNHAGMTLARTKPGTLKLAEESNPTASPIYGVTGLHTEALLDPQNMYVQAMRSAVDRGDLDEMSFAFRVIRDNWSKEWDRRRIQEVSVDKGDVSLVNFGANAHTGGTVALRQRRGPLGLPSRQPDRQTARAPMREALLDAEYEDAIRRQKIVRLGPPAATPAVRAALIDFDYASRVHRLKRAFRPRRRVYRTDSGDIEVEDEAACHRCNGGGQVDLGAGPITCPQCAGSGTGENNADNDDGDDPGETSCTLSHRPRRNLATAYSEKAL